MTTEKKLIYWRDRYRRIKAEKISAQPIDPLLLISEMDLHYIAGLIDGEGCFGIIVDSRNVHIPTMQISMADKSVLDWMALLFGVKCGRAYRTMLKETHRDQYKVRLGGHRCVLLCSVLGPILRVKQRQAAVLLQFGKTYDLSRKPISAEVHRQREKLRREIMALNRPGRSSSEGLSVSIRRAVSTNVNNTDEY